MVVVVAVVVHIVEVGTQMQLLFHVSFLTVLKSLDDQEETYDDVVDETALAVNILEAVDMLPHLSGGDPACAFGGRVDFAISRSLSYNLGCID
jgi:hypothetical protein